MQACSSALLVSNTHTHERETQRTQPRTSSPAAHTCYTSERCTAQSIASVASLARALCNRRPYKGVGHQRALLVHFLCAQRKCTVCVRVHARACALLLKKAPLGLRPPLTLFLFRFLHLSLSPALWLQVYAIILEKGFMYKEQVRLPVFVVSWLRIQLYGTTVWGRVPQGVQCSACLLNQTPAY